MKSVKEYYSSIIIFAISILIFSHTLPAQNAAPRETTITVFENQAKAYSKLREDLEAKMAPLAKEATAEQIEAHKVTFQKSVQTARQSAKQGDIFTPAASQLIRTIIKTEFTGKDRAQLRETVFEAENKGVPVKVNIPYPEAKEQLEMPPTLLLNLPKLPKQLRYRFVGTNLLLVDRENGLIIDFMTNAVP
jgi:hypothetical protein